MTELETTKITRKSRKKRKRSDSTSSEEEWFSSDGSVQDSMIAEDQEEQFASGPWTYDLDKMLVKKQFEIKNICREMSASDFTLEFVQENGLEEPLLFKDSLSSLGMKMPKDGTLTVRCVLKAVGDRLVEVVDVMTQGSRQMMLSDFVDYYESPPAERKDLLNLLSLEFSLTPLAKRVRGPTLAQEIDWVELFWPSDRRNSPSTFPKVQNYCLMSVKKSFTDFHIDFGGTSVWYHVYKGRKTFWVIEPTEENILKYEKWVLEGSQHEAFFGDLVDKCTRIELYEGYTFVIPSGWIHAVYTPEDSLVFGGNFLHSFSIPMQIRINRSENVLLIKEKYRYPKYMEMVWYVIENIVKKATGLIYEIDKTIEAVESSTDDKAANNGIEEKSSVNSDVIMMLVNSVEENASNNVTAGVKKETNEDIPACVGSTSNEAKENVTDPAGLQVKSLCEIEENSLTFDNAYLATVSEKERKGYKALLDYVREVVKDYKDSKSQKMNDLLDVFEKVLNHELPERFVTEKKKKRNVEEQTSSRLTQWLAAFGKNKSPVAKRKAPPKEKTAETQQFSRPKPPKSKIKSSKKSDHHKPDGPLIVGGIPPAIMPADAPQAPNPYGYDPLASVTPLGHKQLPSAYRRTPDMAKAPPSQKFRLQPQIHKVVIAATEKMETMQEKILDKSLISITSLPGPSIDNKSADYEDKIAAVAHVETERSPHHSEIWRPHRDRDKDNQRENRHVAKEEYPELQYRSPLVRPGSSNKGTNIASELGYKSYRYLGKGFKRRYTDSPSAANCWPNRRSGPRHTSDCDSKKNEYSTSWRLEACHKSDSADRPSIFPRSLARSWPEEVPTVAQHTYALPGDPRLPSAEGLSRWSPAVKERPVKEHERGKNPSIVQPIRIIEKRNLNITTTVTHTPPLGNRKTLSPVSLGSSQYVSLLSREWNPISKSVSDFNTAQYPSGNEHGIISVTSSLSLPEANKSAANESEKSSETIKKPEIRDLSVTLNEGKEDDAGIITAAEELAELTKVFDVDERDSEKKETELLMVTEEQRINQQSWNNLKKNGVAADETADGFFSPKNLESDSISPRPKPSRIPTETVLQNLSSLTAEFNAVSD